MYISVIFWLICWCCSKTEGQKKRGLLRVESRSSLPRPPALTNNKHAITSPMKKRRLTKKRTCKLCLPKTWSKGAIIGDKWTEARQTPARELGVPPLAITNTLFFVIYCCLSEISLSLSLSPISISPSPSSKSPLAHPVLTPNQPPFLTARPSLAFNHAEKAQPGAHWQYAESKLGFFLFPLSVDNCRLQIAWPGKKRVDFTFFIPFNRPRQRSLMQLQISELGFSLFKRSSGRSASFLNPPVVGLLVSQFYGQWQKKTKQNKQTKRLSGQFRKSTRRTTEWQQHQKRERNSAFSGHSLPETIREGKFLKTNVKVVG